MRWTLLINLSPPPPLENHVGITILFLINGLNAITKQKTISPEAAAGGGGVRRRGGGVRRWRRLALGYFIEHFTNAAKQ